MTHISPLSGFGHVTGQVAASSRVRKSSIRELMTNVALWISAGVLAAVCLVGSSEMVVPQGFRECSVADADTLVEWLADRPSRRPLRALIVRLVCVSVLAPRGSQPAPAPATYPPTPISFRRSVVPFSVEMKRNCPPSPAPLP